MNTPWPSLISSRLATLSLSVHLTDFDGDGWLELLTANGHVYPQADLPDTGTSYGQRATLWRLIARGDERRLERILPSDGESVLAPALGARGTAVGDFDGDGAPDVVLDRIDGPAALGMNRFPRAHRLVVRCLGPDTAATGEAGRPRTPADGMGSRVIVVPRPNAAESEFALLGKVETAVGYQSASSAWLYFGLGAASEYVSLRVLWPSGRVEELGAGAADRRIVVREGRGIVGEERLP